MKTLGCSLLCACEFVWRMCNFFGCCYFFCQFFPFVFGCRIQFAFYFHSFCFFFSAFEFAFRICNGTRRTNIATPDILSYCSLRRRCCRMWILFIMTSFLFFFCSLFTFNLKRFYFCCFKYHCWFRSWRRRKWCHKLLHTQKNPKK